MTSRGGWRSPSSPGIRRGPEVSDCRGVETWTASAELSAETAPCAREPHPVAWARDADPLADVGLVPVAASPPTPWNAPATHESPGSPVSRGERRDILRIDKELKTSEETVHQMALFLCKSDAAKCSPLTEGISQDIKETSICCKSDVVQVSILQIVNTIPQEEASSFHCIDMKNLTWLQ